MTRPHTLQERLWHDTLHGQVLDHDRRYLLMRTDVFMGLFARLPADAREQALTALADSVAVHGGDSVRAYAAQWKTQSADPAQMQAALLSTMAEAAAVLGWGVWHFEPHDRGLRLQVVNSPFATAARALGQAGSPVCHAIRGMAQALGQALWGECVAYESHCAAMAGDAHERAICRIELCIPPFDNESVAAADAASRATARARSPIVHLPAGEQP